MSKKQKIHISESALIQRLNRAMGKEGMRVKKSRGSKMFSQVGEFYVVDINSNFVCGQDVSLEELGKKWECLAGWETLAKDA